MRFLSKGKIRAILSLYLAEHDLLTVQPIFMKIFVLIRRSCVLCLTINFFAFLIDISAVFCNIVLVCQSDLWQVPSNDTTAEEACCHAGNSGDRTFLVSSFPCVGEDFLKNTVVVMSFKTKRQRKRLKYSVC